MDTSDSLDYELQYRLQRGGSQEDDHSPAHHSSPSSEGSVDSEDSTREPVTTVSAGQSFWPVSFPAQTSERSGDSEDSTRGPALPAKPVAALDIAEELELRSGLFAHLTEAPIGTGASASCHSVFTVDGWFLVIRKLFLETYRCLVTPLI
eukprot:m.328959 g.328959  ORF g.328959 m.328959 type:complete len:150 (-) comp55596_c0_seq7:709-1158(-)